MTREELLKNKGYWIAKLQLDLYNQLSDYMKEKNLNRTRLANELGVTKGYISQILNGDFNHRISKLVELSLAMNKAPVIEYKDISKIIEDDKHGYKTITWTAKPNLNSTISSEKVIPLGTQVFTTLQHTDNNFNDKTKVA